MSGTARRTVWSVALVAIAPALVASGCDIIGYPTDIPVGILAVRTVTGGVNIDPDGYQFEIDSGSLHDIRVNVTASHTLAATDYSVNLIDIATNCSVDANPQVATVRENETVTVTFNVTCS